MMSVDFFLGGRRVFQAVLVGCPWCGNDHRFLEGLHVYTWNGYGVELMWDLFCLYLGVKSCWMVCGADAVLTACSKTESSIPNKKLQQASHGWKKKILEENTPWFYSILFFDSFREGWYHLFELQLLNDRPEAALSPASSRRFCRLRATPALDSCRGWGGGCCWGCSTRFWGGDQTDAFKFKKQFLNGLVCEC